MRGNRRRDSRPELALRSALHRAGYRFFVDYQLEFGSIRMRPDIVFPRKRVVIFLDGCFWHACPSHGRLPNANSDYWTSKLLRNVARDERNVRVLEENGWRVARVWEHYSHEEMLDRVKHVLK
jgi:DNA mismatch endonuclease (patch repair protein)